MRKWKAIKAFSGKEQNEPLVSTSLSNHRLQRENELTRRVILQAVARLTSLITHVYDLWTLVSSIVRLEAKSSCVDDYDFKSDVARHPRHHFLGNLRVLRESDIFLEMRSASHPKQQALDGGRNRSRMWEKRNMLSCFYYPRLCANAVFSHTRGRKSRVGNVCTMRTHTQRAAYPEEGGMKFSSFSRASFSCVMWMEDGTRRVSKWERGNNKFL